MLYYGSAKIFFCFFRSYGLASRPLTNVGPWYDIVRVSFFNAYRRYFDIAPSLVHLVRKVRNMHIVNIIFKFKLMIIPDLSVYVYISGTKLFHSIVFINGFIIKLLCCTRTRTNDIRSTMWIPLIWPYIIHFLTKARRMSSDLFLIICHNFLWHFDLYVTLGFFLNCGLWDSLWAFYWYCTEKPSTVHQLPHRSYNK